MASASDAKKADKAAAEESTEKDGDAAAEPKRRRFAGKTLVLFVVAPLLLFVGVGAGAHFMGLTAKLFGGGEEEKQEQVAAQPPKPAVFYNLPEMLVNLNSAGRRTSFLKISVSLELESATDIPRIEAVMPRIVDNFQIYLRELRVEDLRGSAGLYRLREELLARVNNAAQPAKVNDVLFKEMLVQ
ncbi:MAG TPA: flagellar basal body-associated FliL family protein [Alphaproteobacteria bacterium]|nr:flagellar basal body-associated FliL family protein [Alphaproteobacteria bacterium]